MPHLVPCVSTGCRSDQAEVPVLAGPIPTADRGRPAIHGLGVRGRMFGRRRRVRARDRAVRQLHAVQVPGSPVAVMAAIKRLSAYCSYQNAN